MTRTDEWHIKVDTATKRRFKVYAAMHGLTLGAALAQLLDADELGGDRAQQGGAAAPRTDSVRGRAGAAMLRPKAEGRREQSGPDTAQAA
jgi:hypothetical protein